VKERKSETKKTNELRQGGHSKRRQPHDSKRSNNFKSNRDAGPVELRVESPTRLLRPGSLDSGFFRAAAASRSRFGWDEPGKNQKKSYGRVFIRDFHGAETNEYCTKLNSHPSKLEHDDELTEYKKKDDSKGV